MCASGEIAKKTVNFDHVPKALMNGPPKNHIFSASLPDNVKINFNFAAPATGLAYIE